MPFSLGFWAAAGGSSGGGSAFELISTAFGNGSSTQIEFTSIAQTYKHLQVRYTVLMPSGGEGAAAFMRLNSDNGSTGNYAYHYLRGNGSAVSSGNATSAGYMSFANPVTGIDSSIWNIGVIDLLDYKSTTKNKTMRALTGMAGPFTSNRDIEIASGLWQSTAAITTIVLRFSGFAPTSASRFSLYGWN